MNDTRKDLEKLTKEELIEMVLHWQNMYEELNEYVENEYDDYA